jgi:hypothetical protein
MPELDETAAARAAARNHGAAARNHGAAAPGGAAPSRRSMLRVAAGAGAAGIAATTLSSVVGGMAARASTMQDSRAGRLAPGEATGSDPIVLHVRDAAAGEIDIFRGTTLTTLRDRDLAARIVRAGR